MKLKIKVTKEVLRKSANSHGNFIGSTCAIAVACKEVFGDVWIYEEGITLLKNPPEYSGTLDMVKVNTIGTPRESLISLPYEAVAFIREFDSNSCEQRIVMEPIEFEVEVPEKVIERINIDDLKDCPTIELVS